MTPSPVLPALAVQLVAAADCLSPDLVSRTGARALHLHRKDLTTSRSDFTPAGALAGRCRPLCGQRARRWHRASVDGRPLCRRCAKAAARLATTAGVTRERAARLLTVADLTAALEHARTSGEVSEAVQLACEAGLIAAVVQTDDGPVLLSRLIRTARQRLSRPPVVGQRDRNWADRLNPPGSRYPRRYR